MKAAFKRVAQFYHQFFRGKTTYVDINLSGATLDGLAIHQVCDFSGASFHQASLIGVHMPDLIMKEANFDQSNLTHAILRNGFFQNATFCRSILKKANLTGANLQYADFSDANLTNTKFCNADLRGVNFKGADLTNADFEDSIYNETTRFDADIDPERLGMKSSNQPQRPQSNDFSFFDAFLRKKDRRKASIEKNPQVLYYRGCRIAIGEEEQEEIDKDIFYYDVFPKEASIYAILDSQ